MLLAKGKSGLSDRAAQLSRNCSSVLPYLCFPPIYPHHPGQDRLSQQELIPNIQGQWISENLLSCRKDEKTEAQRMKWLPEGHSISLERTPWRKDSARVFLAPLVCVQVWLCISTYKGARGNHLPRGALLVQWTPSQGQTWIWENTHCQKGNNQGVRLD